MMTILLPSNLTLILLPTVFRKTMQHMLAMILQAQETYPVPMKDPIVDLMVHLQLSALVYEETEYNVPGVKFLAEHRECWTPACMYVVKKNKVSRKAPDKP